mmetsp:Transcript_8040/g.33053  ORF Transcript_8040/g.33053 Transcript_8040/m.33053 type:complete len:366 (+) Transcript_8040:1166-2263(+)
MNAVLCSPRSRHERLLRPQDAPVDGITGRSEPDARVAEVQVPGQQGVNVGAVDVANLRRGGREGDLGAGGSSQSAPFAPHASTRGRRRQLYGVRAVRGQPLALRHPRRVQWVVELHHLHQVRVPRGFVPRALAVSHEKQSFFGNNRRRADVNARRVRDSGARVRHPAQGDDSRDTAAVRASGASAALQAPVQRHLRRSVLRDGAEGALRSSHASFPRLRSLGDVPPGVNLGDEDVPGSGRASQVARRAPRDPRSDLLASVARRRGEGVRADALEIAKLRRHADGDEDGPVAEPVRVLDADEEVRVGLGDAIVASPEVGGFRSLARAAVGGNAVAVLELVRRGRVGDGRPAQPVPRRELAVDAVAG